MNAVSMRSRTSRNGLRPTSLVRDLRAIAELIELCFGEHLDRRDLAAVREMRAVGSLGPLLWVLGAFDTAGLGLGFVWLDDGRLVGNVSTHRVGQGLSGLGPGWVIANVAVHPDHRRRGIARTLMEAALHSIVQQGGRWVVLQLEHDNQGARALYEGLGFEEVGRLTQWVHTGDIHADQLGPAQGAAPRQRGADEWEAEMALAARDRVSGLAWTRPLERSHFRQGLLGHFWDVLNGKHRVRWVLDDGERLLGSLWVETVPLSDPQFTLLLEPSANQAEVGLGLVRQGLRRVGAGRCIRLESSDRDPAFASALGALGFQVKRTLVQMRWLPR